MLESKKMERVIALKEVKNLYIEFGFSAGMIKGSITEGLRSK